MGRLLKRRLLILAVLLAPLLALHAIHAPRRGPFGNDPSYYMQAARHVAEGDGLLTSVSLYHQAAHPLPQPYSDYPLWPLLLGGIGRVTGLIAAANALPQIFFVVDLVLIYLLANRLAGERGTIAFRGETFDIGHLAAIVVGLNFIFFTVTIEPYTEGLAFALALGSFLVLESHPAWSGVLVGLAVLTRYQMAVVPVAVVIVLLVLRFPLRATLQYLACAAAIFATWLAVLRLESVGRADIEPWQAFANDHVGRGLIAAVNPLHGESLFHSYGPAAVIVLIGLWLCVRMRIRALLVWALLVSGIASVAVLARFEGVRPPLWLFGSRHSLPFAFALIASLVVAIVRGSRTVRVAALILAGASIVQGAVAAFQYPIPVGRGLGGSEAALVRWFRDRDPNATLLTTNPQILSVYSRNRFHWTECDVDPAKTRRMLDKLQIDYVIVYDSERGCRFVRGLDDAMRLEALFQDEFRRIYLFKVTRKITSTGAPSSVHVTTGR